MATAERGGEKHCPARQRNGLWCDGMALRGNAKEEHRSELQRQAVQWNRIAKSRDANRRNCLDKQRKGDEKKSFDCKGKAQNR